jgi:hypothetical protein
MFRWGFVIDNAGIFDVLWYTFFTFGFKWVLLAIALYFASGLQRRFLAAVCILLPLTYCFRFSEEVLANHKFINVWLTIVNVYVGYALVKLWNMQIGPSKLPARVLAVILTLLITIGGAIDLIPIYNSYWIKPQIRQRPADRMAQDEHGSQINIPVPPLHQPPDPAIRKAAVLRRSILRLGQRL